MICFDKIIEIYSIVDEFCKNFQEQTSSFLLGNNSKRPPQNEYIESYYYYLMKNSLMTMADKLLLRKRSVIETVNDELKNICQEEHARYRSFITILINLSHWLQN